MSARIDLKKISPEAYPPLYALDKYVAQSALGETTWNLVKIRVSQLNGCAFCVDLHSFDAGTKGETLERLFALATWREAPFFTDAERAALALAEATTTLRPGGVPDAVWNEAADHFDEARLGALLVAIATINMWNRMAVATRMVAGASRSASR